MAGDYREPIWLRFADLRRYLPDRYPAEECPARRIEGGGTHRARPVSSGDGSGEAWCEWVGEEAPLLPELLERRAVGAIFIRDGDRPNHRSGGGFRTDSAAEALGFGSHRRKVMEGETIRRQVISPPGFTLNRQSFPRCKTSSPAKPLPRPGSQNRLRHPRPPGSGLGFADTPGSLWAGTSQSSSGVRWCAPPAPALAAATTGRSAMAK